MFTNRGYYSIKLPNGVKIVSLNSVVFSSKTNMKWYPDDEAKDQMDWLNEELYMSHIDKHQVILIDKIYAGANVYSDKNPMAKKFGKSKLANAWRQDMSEEFFKTTYKYRDNILMEITGDD